MSTNVMPGPPAKESEEISTRFTTALRKVEVCKQEFLLAQRANADLTAALRVAMQHSPAPEHEYSGSSATSSALLLDIKAAMAKRDCSADVAVRALPDSAVASAAQDVMSSIKAAMAKQDELNVRVVAARATAEAELAQKLAEAASVQGVAEPTAIPLASAALEPIRAAMARKDDLTARIARERAAAEASLAKQVTAAEEAKARSEASTSASASSTTFGDIKAALARQSSLAAQVAAAEEAKSRRQASLVAQVAAAEEAKVRRAAGVASASTMSASTTFSDIKAALMAQVKDAKARSGAGATSGSGSGSMCDIEAALARRDGARKAQAILSADGEVGAAVAAASAAAPAAARKGECESFPTGAGSDIFASIKSALAKQQDVQRRELEERAAAESALAAKMDAARKL